MHSRSPSPAAPRRWAALGVISVAQLMVVLDGSIVNIALPQAQQALGISNASRQWVVTAYGGLLLLGGRLADAIGRKRAFIIGLGRFSLASALGLLVALLVTARRSDPASHATLPVPG